MVVSYSCEGRVRRGLIPRKTDKRGVERLREALETTDWEGDVGEGEQGSEGSEGGGDDEGETELREAILHRDEDGEEEDEDEEVKVEELEAMMLKLQTARGMFLSLIGPGTGERVELT